MEEHSAACDAGAVSHEAPEAYLRAKQQRPGELESSLKQCPHAEPCASHTLHAPEHRGGVWRRHHESIRALAPESLVAP